MNDGTVVQQCINYPLLISLSSSDFFVYEIHALPFNKGDDSVWKPYAANPSALESEGHDASERFDGDIELEAVVDCAGGSGMNTLVNLRRAHSTMVRPVRSGQ
jgi:hypothetical protein